MSNSGVGVGQMVGEQDGRKDRSGLFGLDREIEQDGDIFFGEGVVRREGLRDVNIVDVVDSHFGRDVGTDSP